MKLRRSQHPVTAWLLIALAVAAMAAPLAGSASAQSPEGLEELERQQRAKLPDPVNGFAIASKLCASCHQIGTNSSGGAPDVPPFATIARRPDQSPDRLARWLMQPHAPMPDLQLTQKEIRDLAAHIMALKED